MKWKKNVKRIKLIFHGNSNHLYSWGRWLTSDMWLQIIKMGRGIRILSGLVKKKFWNFPLSLLGGSSMPQFSITKKKNNMVLKQTYFFPIMTPPDPPHHSPSGRLGWGYQEGDVGLIKVKKQVDFKIHFRWFKAFLDHVLFYFFFH